MTTEEEKILLRRFYSELCNLLNSLEDDLNLDLEKGEKGYKTYEESHKAVSRYTLRLLKRRERAYWRLLH